MLARLQSEKLTNILYIKTTKNGKLKIELAFCQAKKRVDNLD